jgi:uncharacterized membrane protein
MSRHAPESAPLERRLAWLLHYGTWLATLTIATGLAIGLLNHFKGTLRTGVESTLPVQAIPSGLLSTATGTHIVTAGIALFILLPVMRLILMLGIFLRQRDYRFSLIAALVLAIIAAGLLVGAA